MVPSSVALGLADAGPADAELAFAGLLTAADVFALVLQPTAASTSRPLEHPNIPLCQRFMLKDGNRHQPPAAALGA
jgi:hypothetical protein